MRIRRPEDDNLELQMASLMDCIFILLIFFVVTTTMKKSRKQMPIELPESSASVTVAEKPNEVILGIDAKGQKYFNGERVTTTVLLDKLREVSLADPKQRLRLDADRDVRYNDVVEVIEAAQFQGLSNIALRTRDQTAR